MKKVITTLVIGFGCVCWRVSTANCQRCGSKEGGYWISQPKSQCVGAAYR